MGKRKNDAEENIENKLRKLEAMVKSQSRRRIRVLDSSSGEDEDDDAANRVVDDEPSTPLSSPPSQHSPPRPGPSREDHQPPQALSRPASPQPGPSSAPDPPVVETEETTSSPEDVELDEEILKLLGDAPKPDSTLGKSIHKDVASRWKEILLKGLQKEVKEKILEEYLIPSNCQLLIAPTLNPEAKAALPEYLVKRDASLMYRQKQTGSALAALAQATEMIIKQNSSPQDILKPLSDACRILCDSHFSDTRTRRKFVISAINTNLKDALINTERDKFLFGDNVSDKVKAAQNIQKSGNTLKTAPKPSYNPLNRNSFAVRNKNQKSNLNYKPLHQKPWSQSKPPDAGSRPAPAAGRPNAPRYRAERPRSPPRRPYRR